MTRDEAIACIEFVRTARAFSPLPSASAVSMRPVYPDVIMYNALPNLITKADVPADWTIVKWPA